MALKQFTIKTNEEAILEIDRIHAESGNATKGETLAKIVQNFRENQGNSDEKPIEITPEQPKETPGNTSVQGAIQAENEKLSETVRILSEQVQALSAKKAENPTISETDETVLEVTDETPENKADNQNLSASLQELSAILQDTASKTESDDFQELSDIFLKLSVATAEICQEVPDSEMDLSILNMCAEIREICLNPNIDECFEKVTPLATEIQRLIMLRLTVKAVAEKNSMTVGEVLWHLFSMFVRKAYYYDLDELSGNQQAEINDKVGI